MSRRKAGAMRYLVVGRRLRYRPDYFADPRQNLVMAQTLLAIRDGGEPVIEQIQLGLSERESQIFRPFVQSVAAAVLA